MQQDHVDVTLSQSQSFLLAKNVLILGICLGGVYTEAHAPHIKH